MEGLMYKVTVLGVIIGDVIEGGVLVLFALVILLDITLAFRDRLMLIFSILQIAGLLAGYFWARAVFKEQDVAGPWAWGLVVGIWVVAVALVHLWYVLRSLRSRG